MTYSNCSFFMSLCSLLFWLNIMILSNNMFPPPLIQTKLGIMISQKHATIVLGVISVIALFYILSGIFWWTLASSGFMITVHAGLRDASMHQDGEDQVDMVGEVSSGETAAFLGEPAANKV